MKCLESRTTCAASLCLTIVASVSWAGPTVRLKPEAAVTGVAMHLGDVALIKADAAIATRLKAIDVGPAPLPGKSRPVGVDYVRIRLRQAKFDPAVLTADSAVTCLVTRTSQTLAGDRMVDAARKHLETAIEAGDGKLVIEPVNRPRDMVLPEGELALNAELVGVATTAATRRVTVTVMVDGEPAGKADIALRVRRYAKVAVAKASISRGTALSNDLVTYEERDCMTLPPDVMREGDVLDGLQAQQAISAHMALTRRAAAEPPVVHVGDTVTISAGTGAIHISAPGLAAEDGRIGQVIRVRNTDSNKEFRATVVDARNVEANL